MTTHASISCSHPKDGVNIFVEIPQGSGVKYELDKTSGLLMVDRFIHTAMTYPFNYGFVPGTLADDGDPLDALLICDQPVYPCSLVAARPIGVLEMEDEAGMDAKIIAVPMPNVDPFYAEVHDIKDVDRATQEKIKHFFNRYKELEPGKWVKITAFLGAKEAQTIIDASFKAYKAGA